MTIFCYSSSQVIGVILFGITCLIIGLAIGIKLRISLLEEEMGK